MTEKLNFLECWTSAATSLFAQALAGEPVLSESLPKPMGAGSFGFAATVEGEESGRFAVLLDGSLLEATLLGEGVDQKAAWAELLKEVAGSAAGELLAKTGRSCQVTAMAESEQESKISRSFELAGGDRSWQIQVLNEVRLSKGAAAGGPVSGKATTPRSGSTPPGSTASETAANGHGGQHEAGHEPGQGAGQGAGFGLTPGLELLLDVELEASLRFGAREISLAEILELGPGDVVQLDRHITDPVELIVGDKIVARGDVVLVDGNFGLRVTEVAEPQRKLESIRCLF